VNDDTKITIEPSGGVLGATLHGLDLAKPPGTAAIGQVMRALGRYGVIRFPNQTLDPASQTAFARSFGRIHASARFRAPGVPEVSFLSNIKGPDGQTIGYPDAGMLWHKDLTAHTPGGYATILYAMKVPQRDGKSLGDTKFTNVQAAYDDLPPSIKQQLRDAIGIHSSEEYNASTRKSGSVRPAYQEGAVKNPPVPHPLVMIHPVTGQEILYCDPGHVVRIENLPPGVDPVATLAFLNEHQLQEKYQYSFRWSEGDALMWDNLGVIHRGTLDYTPAEPRLMTRSLILGDKVFDPGFVKAALGAAA
jgi:taurine dioxygenase